VTTKKCNRCNTPTEENTVFCSECGNELNFADLNSSANQSTENENYIQPTVQHGRDPAQLTYSQQDSYEQQQEKNYRRKRMTSKMISRIISFAIMMALIYTLGYIFLD